METFYTIIKIAPNTMTDDCLSIGLLVFDNHIYTLKFSEERKKVLKQLMNDNGHVIDFIIKQITNYIQNLNNEYKSSNTQLFTLNALLNSDYFNYLNNYSNGLLRFSKPTFLNDNINETTFLLLYNLLIDKNMENEISIKKIPNGKFYETINNKLIKKVEDKIHTKFKINANLLPTMYFQYEMDCIGLNGVFVGAKSIPFNKSISTLDKEISHYITLITLLSSKYAKDISKNNFYLIANEPLEIKSPEHNTWEYINKNPLFKVVHSEQVNIIVEKVVQTKATTFFENA